MVQEKIIWAIQQSLMMLTLRQSMKQLKNNWQILTHANGDAMDQMIRTMKPLAAKNMVMMTAEMS
jgi:hypothetical protein